jgi:hypothetical protein
VHVGLAEPGSAPHSGRRGMGVTLEQTMPSRVAKPAIKIRNEKRIKRT